jgi:hypothetical protein
MANQLAGVLVDGYRHPNRTAVDRFMPDHTVSLDVVPMTDSKALEEPSFSQSRRRSD